MAGVNFRALLRVLRATMVLICVGAIPGSAEAAEPFAEAGAGATSCSRFAQLYRKNPELNEAFFFAWAQGYMSAMNMWKLDKVKLYADLSDSTAAQARIRKFCDKHPLAPYRDAVLDAYGVMALYPMQSNPWPGLPKP